MMPDWDWTTWMGLVGVPMLVYWAYRMGHQDGRWEERHRNMSSPDPVMCRAKRDMGELGTAECFLPRGHVGPHDNGHVTWRD